MLPMDRRAWLRAAGLAIGGLGVSRLASAQPSAPAAAADGGIAVARLGLNENPYGPAPAVTAALEREFKNLCRYTGAEYSALLERIAAHESVPKEQIILGEILEPLGTYLSLQGGPGGEFIYSDPGYTALIDAAAAVGGHAIGVPLDAHMHNDLPAISARVSAHTRAVFLVNPHNPTGIVSEPEELKSFARTISRRALCIVDEAYLEFAGRYQERTLADLVRGNENVIVFRTFAKVYGLAGLDIGYGLMPRGIAGALRAQGLDNPHLFNRLAVAAAAASLQDAAYVGRVTRQVEEEREKWFRLFRELKVRFTPSGANFVFFETGMPHVQFAAALLKEHIEIGRAFAPYDHWARISIGLPQENAMARAAVHRVIHPVAA
jgi:histidinol-phosphate aminotransferase